MSEDIFKAVGGNIAGEAGNDIVTGILDLIAETARQELSRRHPGALVEDTARGSLPGAIASDELDAQLAEGTAARDGVKG